MPLCGAVALNGYNPFSEAITRWIWEETVIRSQWGALPAEEWLECEAARLVDGGAWRDLEIRHASHQGGKVFVSLWGVYSGGVKARWK